jgi:hypothetical protein
MGKTCRHDDTHSTLSATTEVPWLQITQGGGRGSAVAMSTCDSWCCVLQASSGAVWECDSIQPQPTGGLTTPSWPLPHSSSA